MMRQFSSSGITKEFKTAPFTDLKIVFWMMVYTSILIPFNENLNVASAEFQTWLYVGSFMSAVSILTLLIAQKILIGKYGNQVPVSIILIGAAMLGAFKGASTQFLVNHYFIKDSYHLDEIAIRAFSGACLGVLIAFVLALRAKVKEQVLSNQTLLDQENASLAEEISRLTASIYLLRNNSKDRIINKILSNLRPEIVQNLTSADPEKNWRKISSALRDGLANKVRQESYQLSNFRLPTKSRANRVWEILGFKVFNIHPRVAALVQLAASISIIYTDFAPNQTVLNLFCTTFFAYLISYLVKKLYLENVSSSKLHNVVAFFLIILFNMLTYYFVRLLIWDEVNLQFGILVLIWYLQMYISISAVSEVIKNFETRKLLSDSVHEDLLDKKRVLESYEAKLRNDLSKHLHGYLIAKIQKTTSQLEGHGESGDFESFKQLMNTLLEEFTVDKFQEGLIRGEISSEFFDSFTQSWDGLVQIRFTGNLLFFERLQRTQRVEIADVIEELVINAHRHAQASNISIDFEFEDDGDLKIVATNDGLSPKETLTSGFGSRIFDAATDSRWQLLAYPAGGAEVSLRVRPYEPESDIPVSRVEFEASGLRSDQPMPMN